MDLEHLKKVISKGQISPVYLLHGEEEFFIRESLTLLKSAFLKGSDVSTSLMELDGREATGGAVFDELRTTPLFGATGKRMVVVENADDFIGKHSNLLEKYLDTHVPYSCLVLICKKLDKKTKLAKKINRISGDIDCKRLKEYQLDLWISLRARHYGKTTTPQAVQSLKECIGNKLSLLDKHLEKLSIYLDERTKIEEDDIENLVSVNRTRTIFELTDAMAQKNTERALKVLSQLLAAGEDSVRIISMLAWQIKRLWQAKHILNKGGKAETVASELGIRFYLREFITQTEHFTEASLQKKHEQLLLADFQSKTSGINERLLLECLVYKLCR
jgi:DNA polymerase-3 subunit delta